jgi:hypothetical protein
MKISATLDSESNSVDFYITEYVGDEGFLFRRILVKIPSDDSGIITTKNLVEFCQKISEHLSDAINSITVEK